MYLAFGAGLKSNAWRIAAKINENKWIGLVEAELLNTLYYNYSFICLIVFHAGALSYEIW